MKVLLLARISARRADVGAAARIVARLRGLDPAPLRTRRVARRLGSVLAGRGRRRADPRRRVAGRLRGACDDEPRAGAGSRPGARRSSRRG
jgi:hypothetical protein